MKGEEECEHLSKRYPYFYEIAPIPEYYARAVNTPAEATVELETGDLVYFFSDELAMQVHRDREQWHRKYEMKKEDNSLVALIMDL